MSEQKPRKEAKQKRSIVTVNSIITATAQLLKDKGLNNLTTSNIIERAGVSVGSFYQYFPSKESILSVILQKNFNQDAQDFINTLKKVNSLNYNFDEAIDYLVDMLFDNFKIQTGLHKELIFSVLTLNSLKFTLVNDDKVTSAIKEYIMIYQDELREGIDLDRAAFLFQYILKGIKFGIIFAGKENWIDELKDDLKFLLKSYFKK